MRLANRPLRSVAFGARAARLLGVVALGLTLTLTLTGCSQMLEIPYPDLSSIKRLGDGILSKSETEQAIKDLEAEQKKQQEDAKKRVEAP